MTRLPPPVALSTNLGNLNFDSSNQLPTSKMLKVVILSRGSPVRSHEDVLGGTLGGVGRSFLAFLRVKGFIDPRVKNHIADDG